MIFRRRKLHDRKNSEFGIHHFPSSRIIEWLRPWPCLNLSYLCNGLFTIARKPHELLQRLQMKQTRFEALDFTKGVLIVLMIAFHFVYIGDSYPYLKKIVYTFHMPAFLILSGYFMNIEKKASRFFSGMLRFLIPYILLESGYILMASILPIREHIDSLTLQTFVHHFFISPLGPYWYLHTLMVCGVTYYTLFRLHRLQVISRIFLLALCYYLLSLQGELLALSYAMYFLIGVSVRHLSQNFTSVFRPSVLAIPCFLLLVVHPGNLSTSAVGSLGIIYCAISICLFAYRDNKPGNFVAYLGRNSLPIYLYSPLFTFACKPLVPWLSFDSTGVLFLLIALTITISGTLFIHRLIHFVTERLPFTLFK